MILYCDFEELAALAAAVTRSLETAAGHRHDHDLPDAASDLEALLPRLSSDIEIQSLAECAAIRRAVSQVTDELRARLDIVILEQHPAAEDAVLAYFDYGHALSVLSRVERIHAEMSALAELLTGEPATTEAAQRFTFPSD